MAARDTEGASAPSGALPGDARRVWNEEARAAYRSAVRPLLARARALGGIVPACDPVAQRALSCASDLDASEDRPGELGAFDHVRGRVQFPWTFADACPIHGADRACCPYG
ncbi:MAG: hypothetical protein CME87_00250 [Herbaspirillum sp.]|nr:hypothetical protein [Herbaspirillum sp.]